MGLWGCGDSQGGSKSTQEPKIHAAVCSEKANSSSPCESSDEKVTFSLKFSKDHFSENRDIQIWIYSQKDLAVRDQTDPNCTVSQSSDGVESSDCPDAPQPTPYKISYKKAELTETLEINTDHVQNNEKFEIFITGLSTDNCNTTSAREEGFATTATVELEIIDFMTTLMACVEEP